MRGKLISFEGLDGSGKTTQTNMLLKYFENNNLTYKYIHFPRLEDPVIGDMISKFLRGEFGKIEAIDQHFVALMYSMDRYNAKDMITEWLKCNQYVIIDRYVYSNIAFQCAKIKDAEERNALLKWIVELEYNYNSIPKPDISLYLHVPFDFVADTLKNERNGEERNYLNGLDDIHESNISLQRNVETQYLNLVRLYSDFKLINCFDSDKNLLPASTINKMIIDEINNCSV